jgi:phosphate transport system protein
VSKISVESVIEDLKKHVLEAGTLVKNAVYHACAAAHEKSEFEISKVLFFEEQINKHHSSLDNHCMQALAKLSPFGQDLRMIISVIKINADLERMGDQSRNIVRILKDDFEKSQSMDVPAFKKMMDDVKWMVDQSIECFPRGNVQQAVQILSREQIVDDAKKQITLELLERMKSKPESVKSSLDFIMIVKNLERIADHCTNIAEETIFVMTGKDIRHKQELF